MSELIDRQALLDECLNHYEVGNIEQNCTMDWICKTVKNFPTASPWHRVEDELPEKFVNVILANKRGKHYDIDKGWWNGYSFDRCAKGIYRNVTHWMPLPEPPKEEEHGN